MNIFLLLLNHMPIHYPTLYPSTYASKFWMHVIRGVYHLFTGSYVPNSTGLERLGLKSYLWEELPKAEEIENWLWGHSFYLGLIIACSYSHHEKYFKYAFWFTPWRNSIYFLCFNFLIRIQRLKEVRSFDQVIIRTWIFS